MTRFPHFSKRFAITPLFSFGYSQNIPLTHEQVGPGQSEALQDRQWHTCAEQRLGRLGEDSINGGGALNQASIESSTEQMSLCVLYIHPAFVNASRHLLHAVSMRFFGRHIDERAKASDVKDICVPPSLLDLFDDRRAQRVGLHMTCVAVKTA